MISPQEGHENFTAFSSGTIMCPQEMHVGILTTEKKPGEVFIEPTRVWVTDSSKHPYHVEWLRFESDSPVTGPVRQGPHIA